MHRPHRPAFLRSGTHARQGQATSLRRRNRTQPTNDEPAVEFAGGAFSCLCALCLSAVCRRGLTAEDAKSAETNGSLSAGFFRGAIPGRTSVSGDGKNHVKNEPLSRLHIYVRPAIRSTGQACRPKKRFAAADERPGKRFTGDRQFLANANHENRRQQRFHERRFPINRPLPQPETWRPAGRSKEEGKAQRRKDAENSLAGRNS